MIKQHDQCCWGFPWPRRSSSCSAWELQEHSVAPDATVAAQFEHPGALLERAVAPEAAVSGSWRVEVQRLGLLLERFQEAAVAAVRSGKPEATPKQHAKAWNGPEGRPEVLQEL